MGESLMMLFHLYEALHQAEPAQACRAELRALAESAYAPLHLALDPRLLPAPHPSRLPLSAPDPFAPIPRPRKAGEAPEALLSP
jgi:hypothetical protein